jgi:hypothetical protein
MTGQNGSLFPLHPSIEGPVIGCNPEMTLTHDRLLLVWCSQ